MSQGYPQRSGDDEFATTRWTIVMTAGQASSQEAEAALESLCQAYWFPIYAYVRRRVPSVHEAQDLTQAFFAELLAKGYVRSASKQRGRFRAFLLTSCKHFLSREWAKQRAARIVKARE